MNVLHLVAWIGVDGRELCLFVHTYTCIPWDAERVDGEWNVSSVMFRMLNIAVVRDRDDDDDDDDD